jgi:small subunit ribosomal protein S6
VELRKYEIMLILPADADEAAVKGAVERISRVIGETDGEVTNTDVWGRRRLAFEIDKHAEGYYVVVDMTADPTVITELERVLHLADDVVRFKVVNEPPERKRRQMSATKVAANAAKAKAKADASAAAQSASPPAAAEAPADVPA